MANVHRLGDYQNNNNQNNNYGRPQFAGQQRANNAFQNQPLLGGGGNGGNVQYVDPRRESFFDMLKFTFCPTFTIFSFIFVITLVDIIVFITSLITTGVKGQRMNSENFLGPSTDVLVQFGSNYPYKIKYEYQIWRFFTPMLLHGGFLHIFGNMLTQLILGFMLESLMGPLRVCILYLVSGIGGNLFSALISPNQISVGASTAIFGLESCILAIVCVNWKALDRSPEVRCCLIFFIMFFLLMSLLIFFSSSSNTVDVFGHLGGFITGFFVGCLVMVHLRGQEARARMSYEKIWQMVGAAGTLAFFTICFSLFFTITQPQQLWY